MKWRWRAGRMQSKCPCPGARWIDMGDWSVLDVAIRVIEEWSKSGFIGGWDVLCARGDVHPVSVDDSFLIVDNAQRYAARIAR